MNDQTRMRFKRITLALWACLLAGVGVLVWIYMTTRPSAGVPAEPSVADQPQAVTEPTAPPATENTSASPLEKKFGLQVLGLSLTNNDMAVRVTYKVLAPEKTLLLGETNITAYLINEANGAKLPMIAPPQDNVAKGATLRTTRRMARQAGRFPPPPSRLMADGVYTLDIPNWGLALQSGSKVSLVVNEFRQDGLTVE